jgi:hypothetical protein
MAHEGGTMTNWKTWIGAATGALVLGGLVLGGLACKLDSNVYAEGNYDITYDDNVRVYYGDELIVEIDPAVGGTIDIGEWQIEYDEFCSDPDYSCPTEAYWDEVAIYQPLGYENMLLNVVNIGTIGEQGLRLPGTIDESGDFNLLLGLSASASENCLAVSLSTADGSFSQTSLEREKRYDQIDAATITVTYAAGCEILDGVIIASAITFETDFTGVRTGDVDLGDVEPDPAIDENGEEVADNVDEI